MTTAEKFECSLHACDARPVVDNAGEAGKLRITIEHNGCKVTEVVTMHNENSLHGIIGSILPGMRMVLAMKVWKKLGEEPKK